MKYVFIFVESDLRGKFFYRFKNALIRKSYKPIVITTCPTVWFRAKRHGDIVFLLKNGKIERNHEIPLAKEVLEIRSGKLSLNIAQTMANQWIEKIKNISLKYPPVLCIIYNGTTLLPYIGKWWAQKQNIKCLFFELANIPGKMFVDKWGTNAKSYLYAHPEILDNYKINEVEFKCWEKSYFETKSIVRQAAFSSQLKSVLLFALNHLYFASLLPGIKNKISYVEIWSSKFLNRYRSKKKTTRSFSFDMSRYKPYYLFPMQVTADSQILLNSDVSLLDALAIAMRRSIEDGVTLIIKPHPAELDKTIYTRIQKQYPQAVIMNGDTREMIRKADKIITINSTVGLESILLGKQVEFLGKSFYQYLTQKEEWIPKYIMGYLVNIDYFGTSDITENVLEECLKR